jgi:hypothetical protein
MGDRRGMIRRLPFVSGWTDGRDMPAPAGRTFSELYRQRAARPRHPDPLRAARDEAAIKESR